MTDLQLSKLILEKIRHYHKGKVNAIKRADLLSYCQIFDLDLEDRHFRNIYVKLPIATCSQGLFWPMTIEEKREFKDFLWKRAISIFDRYKNFDKAHAKGKQMDLFGG